jgi:hypothetical protein
MVTSQVCVPAEFVGGSVSPSGRVLKIVLVLVVFKRVLTTTIIVAAVTVVVGVTVDQAYANMLGELTVQSFTQDTDGVEEFCK